MTLDMNTPGLDGRYQDWPLPPEPEDTRYGVPETLECELNWSETLICTIDRTKEKSDMVLQSLSLFAGNDKTYVCYVKDRCLSAIDLTGAIGVLTAKMSKDDSVAVFQKRTDVAGEGEIGAANKGEMYFYLVPADTSTLETGRQYVFDIKVQVGSGKVYTVAEGTILLKQPVNL